MALGGLHLEPDAIVSARDCPTSSIVIKFCDDGVLRASVISISARGSHSGQPHLCLLQLQCVRKENTYTHKASSPNGVNPPKCEPTLFPLTDTLHWE